MFEVEGNTFNTFVRPRGSTQYILVRNTHINTTFACLPENATGLFNAQMFIIDLFCSFLSSVFNMTIHTDNVVMLVCLRNS